MVVCHKQIPGHDIKSFYGLMLCGFKEEDPFHGVISIPVSFCILSEDSLYFSHKYLIMRDNIQVAVRMRPLISREVEGKAATYWKAKPPTAIYQINSPSVNFNFDRVFEGQEENAKVYEEFCSPIVKSVIDGFNESHCKSASKHYHGANSKAPENNLSVDMIWLLNRTLLLLINYFINSPSGLHVKSCPSRDPFSAFKQDSQKRLSCILKNMAQPLVRTPPEGKKMHAVHFQSISRMARLYVQIA
ncbi:hypothetical protein TNCV_1014391 [Trichonephila clavipes]|uniref:Kinesin motor domain-containing protein n=1 Tax=Trichonephila clavipes TaxID=2585209 RepID=A0A8X7B9P8_TRICX|nr:hypothetical protein TNCV_1014391 [Trichonephila clavipes]